MSHENIMRLWNDCVEGGNVRPKHRIIPKTASYTVTSDDFGSVFTTRGATATVTFTLPTVNTNLTGEWLLFINVVDYHMLVEGDNEELVVFNNATADNIGFKTTGKLIGGGLLAICDGTSWIVLPLATETQTLSIDTTSTATTTSTSTTTATSTATSTTTGTLTKTATDTLTKTLTKTATDTGTATATGGTFTATLTRTATDTATDTLTKTATDTTSASATKTSTETDTTTSTATATITATATS